MITVDTSSVIRDLDRFAADSARTIEAQFQQVGRRVWSLVNASKAFKRRTGKLHRSIQWDKRSENRMQIFTASNVRYASFVNDGTRPHDIVAKGGALKFQADGETVFRKRVRHPGTRPTLFFESAVDKAFNEATVQLEKRLQVAVDKFNR